MRGIAIRGELSDEWDKCFASTIFSGQRQLSLPVLPSLGWLGKSYPSVSNSLTFSMSYFEDLINIT